MIRSLCLILLSLTLSCGCSFQWKYGESANGCLIVDGKKREFRYFIPEHAKGVVLPLVLGLHGGGGNPKRFERYSRFSDISKRSASFIVVYPKGLDRHWNDGRNSQNSSVDDVKFISILIDLMPHADKKEVYVTGMSNGALMTQRLACEIPHKLKGVALVGAAMTEALYQNCKTGSALEAIIFFGDKDTAFLDNGNLVSPINNTRIRAKHIGITNTLDYWSERNACDNRQLKKTLNIFDQKRGSHKDDGTTVLVYDYDHCQKRLRFYDIKGGGHRWPDAEAANGFIIKKALNTGNASHEISAASEIVDFFHLIKR